MKPTVFSMIAISVAIATSCANIHNPNTNTAVKPATIEFKRDHADWPKLNSAIQMDSQIEAQITELLASMSLEEKIGQMVQPEISSASPEDVMDYHLGSVLNGGGSWPFGLKTATTQDWVELADEYWEASMDTRDGKVAIPLMWGTDAVHGHSNVFGATLFPHNIGLGAANDPELVHRIGEATAKQVSATGLDWTFAPTLAVVRDDRWGRTYEGYSEDPEIVFNYASQMVSGLQGDLAEGHVVATAKHFIGDGGTELGDDQGNNLATELELINVHAQGYFASISAGVQTVMVSFSSWHGEKLHGHDYLLNDVLKGKMNFDGFVVSDWNGIGQVDGCSNDHCPQAINAGIDMIMVPNDWRTFITNTIDDVNNGAITLARIDDAVRRILRVKYRAQLFTKPKPSLREFAANDDNLSTDSMRALAREAVRESLVLLKNEHNTLPLNSSQKILVVGDSANSMENQTGGWTLSWQGTGNANYEFPTGETIFSGIESALTTGSATLDEDGSEANDSYDVIIAIIGETPYAEGNGDLNEFATLDFSKQRHSQSKLLADLATQAPNTPVVTVYVGGRPLWMNKELNQSDAFVAAWLPGTEGAGVADVLFGDHEFTGRLSYSWPAQDCQTPLNVGDDQTPLFAYGFGLKSTDNGSLGQLSEIASNKGCAAPDTTDSGTTNIPLNLFSDGNNQGDFDLKIGGTGNWNGLNVDVTTEPATTELPGDIRATSVDGSVQFSAMQINWQGNGQIYSQTMHGNDLSAYANSETTIQFRLKVNTPPESGSVNLSTHCIYPCLGEVNIAPMLSALEPNIWHDINIPLQCMIDSGLDITNVNTPFLIWSNDTALDISIEEVSWQPFSAKTPISCSSF
jgi:beta-glucosidase